jgi:hypothetical protein
VKELNRDFKLAGKKRLLDLSSLDEWRNEAYENARLFKEKVKQWHDKRILKGEFHVGEKVLLYRSRLRFFAGKLLSKWEGPYVIEEVYRSGKIKIASLKDNTTQVVNGQEVSLAHLAREVDVQPSHPGSSPHRRELGFLFSKKPKSL